MHTERDSQSYTPLVSVIIPVYNTEESYLRDCLHPFIHHSDSRIEVIVVDDGSQPSTGEILRGLIQDCPNAIQLLHRKNGGQNAARNTGIDASTGEYIEFLDSDDRIDWQSQLKVLDVLETQQPDILGINVIRCTPAGATIGVLQFTEPDSPYHDVPAEYVLRKCGALWNQIVRRDVFEQADIRLLEGIYIGEDLASIAPLIMSARKVGVIGTALYHFVDRPTSITHIVHSERLLDITKAFDFILNWMCSRVSADVFDEAHWFPEIERLAIIHVCFRGVGRAADWEGVHSPAIAKLKNYMIRRFPRWQSNSLYRDDDSMHTLNYRLVISGHYRTYLLCLRASRALAQLKSGKKSKAIMNSKPL